MDKVEEPYMKKTEISPIDNNAKSIVAIFEKRAENLAQRQIEKTTTDTGLMALVFALGKERFAVALKELSEVILLSDCAPIPGAEKAICGIINVRGELHCVLDLPILMGFDLADEEDERSYALILKRNGTGIKVPRLEHILSFRERDLTRKQNESYDMPTQYGQTILKGNIILLSVEKILSHPVFTRKIPNINKY